MTRVLATGLALAYPLLAHASAYLGSSRLALLAGLVLALLVLWPALVGRRFLAWLALALLGGGLLWLQSLALHSLPLFAPPVLLNAFLAWVFGRTLGDGRRSLIERLIWTLHGKPDHLEQRVRDYARRLTAAWALLFATLAALNLLLALIAVPDGLLISAGIEPAVSVPLATWSLFANVLNYLLVAAFFLAEYAFRRRVFPDQPYRNLADFCLQVARLGPQFWRGGADRR